MASLSVVPAPCYGLSANLAAALDPVRFAAACGVTPDSWQADILRSRDLRILMNCYRQSGKSTVAALAALHHAMHVPRSLVLLVSPSFRQSGELFRTVSRLHGWRETTSDERLNLHAMELANGSRILSLPGSEQTIRGFSGVSLLILDEASRIPDDLYHAVTPMLATTGGRLLALSTPFGKRGWFSEAWHGSQDWKRVRVPATEVPRISSAFLEEQKKAMGYFWFNQEFLCSFEDADTSAFRSEDLDWARRPVERWSL